ncbi:MULTISPECIES: hypothetical protein [unclassified Flavobacterium]|uniref:hypothetical protein n=1 Tax=unclassified Flavobacterium TaxID=196869 RepID=UPI0012A9615A|nr:MULTISPECIES: hypothetical protein [unclassified Flavobacterium]MBF4484819.1 hypothetical protein [Flavobacterium sp. CSZ]QGK73768.1 hypothetical protein GIY83_06740 [Flavobacterium sp. SLB02]
MKFQKPLIFLKRLKQLMLLVGLVYAFSNCHIKKSVLHFAGIGSVELSQKSLTQLPAQGVCTVSFLYKEITSKKSFSIPQTPVVPKLKCFSFQTKQNKVSTTLTIHPAFEFNKRSVSFPPIFIVFKKLKIAPQVVLYTA